MNIGHEHKTNFIEEEGIRILEGILTSSCLIKCHFSKNDKTANTDGNFVLINDNGEPEQVFDVQIKSSQSIKNNKFPIDTKFINYMNKGVSLNPGFLFMVDITKNVVYYKFLSNKFLAKNDFTNCEQRNVTVHFSNDEILTDIKDFIHYLNEIVTTARIKTFTPKQIEIAEYQKAFDKLNRFFDVDFERFKLENYSDVWKFGIVYHRKEIPHGQYLEIQKQRERFGLNTSKYDTTYSVFKIKYGSEHNIFQNVKIPIDSCNYKLPVDCFLSSGVGFDDDIESDINVWMEHFFRSLINNQIEFIMFLPNDGLFEIIYNFIDKAIHLNHQYELQDKIVGYLKDEINIGILSELITDSSTFNGQDEDYQMFIRAVKEIKKRNIKFVSRLWKIEMLGEKRIYISHNSVIYYKNSYQFFSSLAKYYNEFIVRLFPNSIKEKYEIHNKYLIYLDIRPVQGGCLIKNRHCKVQYNSSFDITVAESIDEMQAFGKFDITSNGIINLSFETKNNIIQNLLCMLYQQVCNVYKFGKNKLKFKTEFSSTISY